MVSIDLSQPALAPPAGVTPNFENPPNGNGVASFALILMMIVSTLCVLLRAYAKVWVRKSVTLEDALIFAAYGNYWGCAYGSYALIYYPGYFVHNWDVRLRDTILPSYYVFVYGVFYSVVLACLKIAILVEWCRVFVPARKTKSFFWWGASFVIALQIAFGIAAIFLLTFQCIPRAAIWNFTVQGRCLPLNTLQLLSSSIHLFSDIAIFVLPQKIIWGLNMSVQAKVGVAVVFGLGALAVLCSIFRLVATVDYGQSTDTLYKIGTVVLWATGEMTCGFFVACMPTIPKALKDSPLLRKMRRGLGMASSMAGAKMNSKTNERSTGTSGTISGSRKTSRGTTYNELDEDYGVVGVPLEELKTSESTEYLRNAAAGADTRTTYVTVTREVAISRETASNNDVENQNAAAAEWPLSQYGGK